VTEIREDPITGRRVIVVPGRSARPNDHAVPPPSAPSEVGCPFCEGNEPGTPEELAAVRPPGRPANASGWLVRVIPNKFPTVDVPPTETPLSPSSAAGSFPHRPAYGHHEVVIASPHHSPLLPFLPADQVVRVFRMCRDRVRHLSSLPRVGSVTLFENAGPESGGSLWHPHLQLVTLPELPPGLEEELRGIEKLRGRFGGACAIEEVAREEGSDGRRTVAETKEFTAYAPYASSYPYEVRLVPRRHSSTFGELSDSEVEPLASLVSSILRALLGLLPGASYNIVLRSPVGRSPTLDRYHWHLDLYPRLVRPDGFDLATGVAVNTVEPEVAAEALRTALGAKR